MGNKSTSCCSCGAGLATIRTSLFGEDAYYRDNFERFSRKKGELSPRHGSIVYYDAEEGDESHDCLFQELKEQALLKSYKANVWANSIRAMVCHSKGKDSQRDPLRDRPDRVESWQLTSPRMPRDDSNHWWGRTLQRREANVKTSRKEGPCWSSANGEDLRVRCGPNYRMNSLKTQSKGSLYEALSLDAVKADVKIENVVGRLLHDLPAAPAGFTPAWTKAYKVPRIICINMMLPYSGGLNSFNPFAKSDAGCSFIGIFHVRPETLASLQSPEPPAAVKLFQKFYAGPAAAPGAPKTDSNRSLLKRVAKGVKKDSQSGLLKAMAYCDNARDLNVPEIFHRFNGKPCLITKCGYIIRDPAGEWLEIGIDVRGFCTLALSMLSSFRHLLPEARIHYGFLIQASEDEEMPEEILCDMLCYHVDMMQDPVHISA